MYNLSFYNNAAFLFWWTTFHEFFCMNKAKNIVVETQGMHAGCSWFLGDGQGCFLGRTALPEAVVRNHYQSRVSMFPTPMVVIDNLHLMCLHVQDGSSFHDL